MRKNCPTVSVQQRIHALVKLSQFSAQTHVCIFYALHVTQSIYFSFDKDTILTIKYLINYRENRRGNQEQTIQRHWQHFPHKAQEEDKQSTKNTTQHRKLTKKRW